MTNLARKLNGFSAIFLACVICLDLYSGTLKIVPYWVTPILLIIIDLFLLFSVILSRTIKFSLNTIFLSILIMIMILSMIINNHIYIMSVLRLLSIMMFSICYRPSIKSLKLAAKIILAFSLIQAFGVFFEAFFFDKWLSFVVNEFSEAIPDIYYKLVTAQQKIGYLSGLTQNAGFTATYLINGIFAWFIIYQNKSNIISKLILLILFISLIMTGKRGQLLLIIAAFMISFIITDKNINSILKHTLIIISVLIILYILGDYLYSTLKNEGSLQRILKLIYEHSNQDKTSGRIILWKQALEGLNSNPLFGKGWLSFESQFGLEVHNTYLQYLYETGIFGFLFFILYILNSINLFLKRVRSSISRKNGFISNSASVALIYILYFALFSLIENSMVNVEPLMFMMIIFKYGINYEKYNKESFYFTS